MLRGAFSIGVVNENLPNVLLSQSPNYEWIGINPESGKPARDPRCHLLLVERYRQLRLILF